MQLINILDIDPSFILDMHYATAENFMDEVLYSHAACFLRPEVAHALSIAQSQFQDRGLSIKIWDGYRPLSVQKKMFDRFPNPAFIADPQHGSLHNRGAAVDLTLVDLATEEEIPMPTPFDAFEERANSYFPDLEDEVLRNRAILQYVMLDVGFEILPTEWWHFNYREGEQFDLLDVPISDLVGAGELSVG